MKDLSKIELVDLTKKLQARIIVNVLVGSAYADIQVD